jgi:hypothetical protein
MRWFLFDNIIGRTRIFGGITVIPDLQASDFELLRIVLEDLHHVRKVTGPTCTDSELRRVSVQLRHLLVEDAYVRSWKRLGLQPKAPFIIAPRLRTDGLDQNAFAVAGGGDVNGLSIANFRMEVGRTYSPEEARARYEREKGDLDFPFSVSDYKGSTSVYLDGRKVSRKQLIQYVANKKGGAHLDHNRKKDEEVYALLDKALARPDSFGGRIGDPETPGKNSIYLELLSIGQQLTSSPDTMRYMAAAEVLLKQEP